jgi:hypothetical protein
MCAGTDMVCWKSSSRWWWWCSSGISGGGSTFRDSRWPSQQELKATGVRDSLAHEAGQTQGPCAHTRWQCTSICWVFWESPLT